MASDMPAIGKKGKPLPVDTQTDIAKQNFDLMNTLKVDSKKGTLSAKDPKKDKKSDLIGPK